MGKRPINKLSLIEVMLSTGHLRAAPILRAVQRRKLPPGGATEEQKQIRGPKVGKRTKRWRAKQKRKGD